METWHIKGEILVWNTNAVPYDVFNKIIWFLPVSIISVEFWVTEIWAHILAQQLYQMYL